MSKLAYDYTNEELVDAFGKAAAQAGVSNSGLVIDPMAGYLLAEVRYFRGVLLSRLEGKERPFTRGDIVKLSKRAPSNIPSVNRGGEGNFHKQVGRNDVCEITRVIYSGSDKWLLVFKNAQDYIFPAECFEKMEGATAPA